MAKEEAKRPKAWSVTVSSPIRCQSFKTVQHLEELRADWNDPHGSTVAYVCADLAVTRHERG